MSGPEVLCLMAARDLAAEDMTLRAAAAALRARGHARADIGQALALLAVSTLPAFSADGGPAAP